MTPFAGFSAFYDGFIMLEVFTTKGELAWLDCESDLIGDSLADIRAYFEENEGAFSIMILNSVVGVRV